MLNIIALFHRCSVEVVGHSSLRMLLLLVMLHNQENWKGETLGISLFPDSFTT